MAYDFDYIVIGSGFGGSVMACRLVEKKHKVCLLERGREWGMHEFPRRTADIKQNLFWDPKDGKFGIMEFREYPDSDAMSVSASGLGGGSLIYANVLMRMPAPFFEGWPIEINRQTLDPHYDRVLETMEASPYPFGKDPYYTDTPKTKTFKDLSAQLPTPSDATSKPEFIFPDLAIRFKGDFPGQQMPNSHGAIQSKCTKCGECDIGCNIHAKNTLDLNYLFKARHQKENPLEVRTNAQVVAIEPLATGEGYQVTYENPKSPKEKTTITAKRIVLSAGSLGSTGLLLKMRRVGKLKNLSPMLGKRWCGNGDLEGTVVNSNTLIEPTKGPVITGAIQYNFKPYPDGFKHGMYIQDAGIPIGLSWYLMGKIPSPTTFWKAIQLGYRFFKEYICKKLNIKTKTKEINIGDDIADVLDRDDAFRRTFLLLGMGRDRSDGEIQLRDDGEILVQYKLATSSLHYDRVRREMGSIAQQLKGEFFDNPLTHLNKMIAVHPIGGCVMGDSPEDGVVSTRGEVFGHPGLYVVDASIIPTSLGPNPSLTIAALAEHIASFH
jgi:cholesterol oxidase